MSELCRVTSQYVDFEDRIRLTGELTDGQQVVLWLTRRLTERMVPHLVKWLEQSEVAVRETRSPAHTITRSSPYQRFVQESAHSQLIPQPPLQARLGERSWLICSVELKSAPGVLRLTFKGRLALEQVQFSPGERPLRQWLQVIHDLYVLAGWPRDVWPLWMTEGVTSEATNALSLH